MTVLPFLFLVILGITVAVLLVATRPTRIEQNIEVRITDIRNPRRALFSEAQGADLEDLAETTFGSRLGSYLKRYSFSGWIERLILEANNEGSVGAFIITSMQFMLALGVVAGLIGRSVQVAVIAGAVGAAYPTVRLKMARKKRLKAVTDALPDTADLMARALRAGHAMTQAIEVLAERAPQPLAAEFAIVFQQQKLGVPLREVLIELVRRIPSRDLQFLVTAILVQRETGGDLAEILDRTTQVLRERIRVQGEVMVHTAQGRLTGWILSLLPVLMLGVISLFSPSYSHILFYDPLGRRLLYACAGFILTGALVIRKLTQVDF